MFLKEEIFLSSGGFGEKMFNSKKGRFSASGDKLNPFHPRDFSNS